MTFTPPQFTNPPNYSVKVDGSELPLALRIKIVEIIVDQSIGLNSMFQITIEGFHAQEDITNIIDGADIFDFGSVVEIGLGYAGDLTTMIIGEVACFEPEFISNRHPSLIIRGYDRGSRLLTGRRTRTFVQQKDSDIASQIANEVGLTSEVVDTSVTHDYVIQNNESDLDFLNARAKRINYEIFVRDRTLYFRPANYGETEELTITFSDDLIEFNPRISVARQLSEVSVRGWNPAEKSEITGRASSSDIESKMEGESSGPDICGELFQDPVNVVTDRPVTNIAEADQSSKGRLEDSALSFVNARGVCFGRQDLNAGKVIRVEGLGEKLSGNYYVTDAVHNYSNFNGYYTHFTARRNSI